MRFFYSPDYYLALPEGHPFPMGKFREAHAMLVASGVVHERDVELVAPAAREVLERVHTAEYLDAVAAGALDANAARILGLPPGQALLHRSACETEGTRSAAWSALQNGVSVNLAGGTHHAFPGRGEGFCVLNDVAVAIRDLRAEQADLRVFVVDTDAHQGNGTHFIFKEDPAVFTYSIHVGANYPSRKVAGDLDVPLPRYVSGVEYLKALRDSLAKAVTGFRPDLMVWISGADPHRDDRFGQMQLTLRDLMERDRLVTRIALDHKIPLCVLYGGGYNRMVKNTARIHCNTVAVVCEEVLGSVRAGQ